ncbi:MAG: hypothetical protein IKB01_10820 [Lachnospiraceae bacterium]|nr:hypothetical protein [Lachnospiraceae bacterium]MBR2403235.1 hypothetical protein [Lachnospiraceae bacterium]
MSIVLFLYDINMDRFEHAQDAKDVQIYNAMHSYKIRKKPKFYGCLHENLG